MIFKIASNSVRKGLSSWVALLVASAALSVVLTLNIALIVAGTAVSGEAQQAYVSMGGVALAFTVFTGLASFILVVDVCTRLQRREVALWQIAGLLPHTAFMILMVEIVLVSALSAVTGVVAATALWPTYAQFVGRSGLPYSSVLDQGIPELAVVIGVAVTVTVSLLAGVRSSRKVARGDLIAGAKSSSAFSDGTGSAVGAVLKTLIGVALLIGAVAIYAAIGRRPPIENPRDVGDFVTVYPGMGLLLCLVFAFLGPYVIRLLTVILRGVPGRLPYFLAVREACARPALTKALVLPISLAAAAVGIMSSWISKLKDILQVASGSSSSVSAPPEQMALLLAGPIIVACVAASSIVFATAVSRVQDNALLFVSGSSQNFAFAKGTVEAVVYSVVSLISAYIIVIVNEIAMTRVFASGPIPYVRASPPGIAAAGVVLFGGVLTLSMLLTVTSVGMRKESISIVLGSK